MSQRTLIPAILSGLLAVGCTTAHAQEEPAPEPTREQAGRMNADRTNAERRERLIVAEQELARQRAELEEARVQLERRRDEMQTAQVDRRTAMEKLMQELEQVERGLAEARERRGLGEQHPEIVELNAKADELRQRRREMDESLDRERAEMRPIMMELREREVAVDRATREFERMAAEVRGERGPRGGSDPDRRADAPFRQGPRRGARAPDDERIARLERAVEELRRLFEMHGVPADRQARGFAEMERRRRGDRAPRPRGDGDGDAEWPRRERRGAGAGVGGGAGGGRRGEWVPGRPGAGGGPGQPGRPGTAGRFRGEEPRASLPPDAEASRARAEEARVLLERARAENEELRRHVEEMRREMDRMREEMEKLRER